MSLTHLRQSFPTTMGAWHADWWGGRWLHRRTSAGCQQGDCVSTGAAYLEYVYDPDVKQVVCARGVLRN